MPLEILCRNIGSPHVLRYLAVPLVAAGVFAFVPGSEEIEVGLFAVGVFLWSVAFPSPGRGPLNGKKVDFWYYSLAILGVLLFFLSGGVEREKVRLRQSYYNALALLDDAELRKRLFDTIPEKRDELFRAMQAFATQMAGDPATSQQLCQAALEKQRLEKMLQPPGFAEGFELPRLDDPRAICLHALEQMEWSEIAAAGSLEQMLAAIEEQEVADEFPVLLDGIEGSLSEIGEYAVLKPDSDAWVAKRDAIDAEINQAIADANRASEDFQQIGGEIDNPFSLGAADAAARFAWPFILITALGMKLARDPFFFAPLRKA